jgi:hypothetical protein
LTKGQFPNCRSLDSITFSNFTQEEIATWPDIGSDTTGNFSIHAVHGYIYSIDSTLDSSTLLTKLQSMGLSTNWKAGS